MTFTRSLEVVRTFLLEMPCPLYLRFQLCSLTLRCSIRYDGNSPENCHPTAAVRQRVKSTILCQIVQGRPNFCCGYRIVVYNLQYNTVIKSYGTWTVDGLDVTGSANWETITRTGGLTLPRRR